MDTVETMEAIKILEKANAISKDEKKEMNGFEKFITMINPFKCQR